LPVALRQDLAEHERNAYEVVAFTHLDTDHTKGASEFFWFDHAKKYQDEERIQIDELWVPAAVIMEEGCCDDAAVIQAEARHRLREKREYACSRGRRRSRTGYMARAFA
jgi:hypothetical protein